MIWLGGRPSPKEGIHYALCMAERCWVDTAASLITSLTREKSERKMAAMAGGGPRESFLPVDLVENLENAISHGEYHFLRYLLSRHEIDINARLFGYSANRYLGATCLHLAAFKGKVNIVHHLLRLGASKEILDDGGQTPVDRSKTDEVRAVFEGVVPEGEVPVSPPPFAQRNQSNAYREETVGTILAELSRPDNYTVAPKDPVDKLQLARQRIERFYESFKQRVKSMKENSTKPESVAEIFNNHPTLKKSIENFLDWQQVNLVDAVTVRHGEELVEERRRINKELIPRVFALYESVTGST